MRSKKPKPEQQTLFPPAEVEYSNPGTIRAMSTSQLTSDLPYQRGVEQKNGQADPQLEQPGALPGDRQLSGRQIQRG